MANVKSKAKSSNVRQFRKMLEQKSTELKAQLGTPTVHTALKAIPDPYDTADWAEKSHEEWIFLQKNNSEVALLREIQCALERLRDGNFGTCHDCGLPLSRKRLEAVPWAQYCVTCQERRKTGSN